MQVPTDESSPTKFAIGSPHSSWCRGWLPVHWDKESELADYGVFLGVDLTFKQAFRIIAHLKKLNHKSSIA